MRPLISCVTARPTSPRLQSPSDSKMRSYLFLAALCIASLSPQIDATKPARCMRTRQNMQQPNATKTRRKIGPKTSSKLQKTPVTSHPLPSTILTLPSRLPAICSSQSSQPASLSKRLASSKSEFPSGILGQLVSEWPLVVSCPELPTWTLVSCGASVELGRRTALLREGGRAGWLAGWLTWRFLELGFGQRPRRRPLTNWLVD